MEKGGWDTLRTYEIIANKCIPLFLDIKECPSTCITNHPKEKFISSWNSIKNIDVNLLTNRVSMYNGHTAYLLNTDFNIFNNMTIDSDIYMEHMLYLHEYLCKNLTTKNVAKYIIDKTKSVI